MCIHKYSYKARLDWNGRGINEHNSPSIPVTETPIKAINDLRFSNRDQLIGVCDAIVNCAGVDAFINLHIKLISIHLRTKK